MKQTLLIIIITLSVLFCKAQSPIIDIADKETELVDGAYIKDVHNELDKFVGTWVYRHGNTSLTITFQKKVQVQSRYFRDLLIGEYQYIEDGVEKINTLSILQNQANLESPYEHNLVGSSILLKYEFPGCPECDPSEKRVKIEFTDPSPNMKHLNGIMFMGLRYINDNPEKLQISFGKIGTIIIEDGAPLEPNVPFGNYLLVKQ
ncbi:hypothetical protein C1T31_06715 [Hanstruepera neustonica]|uniref:DUF6705 domain-containing protein n=1 Tax=Hanstruepera neustonica TaxID=1445657 RepID=A0A2K1E155_9FLAO|nr:DUF6705 family protein [Hanstruepera neustonica]PNQ74009.1 hypothetical protein C1T31_06715 [Hanstruepera neustonica]